MMYYSCEQPADGGGHAFSGADRYQPPPRVAGRSSSSSLHQLSSARQPAVRQQQQLLPVAASGAGSAVAAQPQQPAARRAGAKKKNAAAAAGAARRSGTTVVATDVTNFRAMVQELTGFPPAAIFRPLPRRVHAASPFAAAAAATSEGTSSSSRYGPGVEPPAMQQQPVQCAAPADLFDGLPDLGSPEFDSWADLSID